MPLLDNVYTNSPSPVLKPSETDVYGNTGTVYRNVDGYTRLGLASESLTI